MNLCSFFKGYSAHGNWIFDNSGISSQYIQIQEQQVGSTEFTCLYKT